MSAEVLQFKASLEKAIQKNAHEEIFDILTALNGVGMTADLLAQTKVAIVVNEAKKKLPEGDRGFSLAKDMMKRWKKVYEKESGAKEEVKSSKKEVEPKKEDADEEMEFTQLPPMRKNALDLFTGHLKLSTNARVASSLAFHIEASIDAILPYNADAKAYSAKVRSLAANLKRNEQLRVDLTEGVLAPQNLVHLTPNELATEEQRAEREKAVKSDMEARRTDYYAVNRAKIMEANGINPNAGGEFTCRKCKGTKTTHYALQTRSADEPMTVFVTCLV